MKEIQSNIAIAERNNDPFPHIYMEGVFSSETYQKILQYLPDTEYYEDFPHPDSSEKDEEGNVIKCTRFRFPVAESFINRLEDKEQREFWQQMFRVLSSEELKMTLFTKFKDVLEDRFGTPVRKINATSRPFLFRDFEGYKILPHPDTPKKALTVLIYLPKGNSHENLCTTMYKQTRDKKGKKVFEQAGKAPYRMNSSLIFPVTKVSYHGVETLPEPEYERNTLMMLYYLGQYKNGDY